MRISDWSSDVCSSDLLHSAFRALGVGDAARIAEIIGRIAPVDVGQEDQLPPAPRLRPCLQPRDRRFGDDIERGALPDIARAAVDRVQHMRAAIARLVALVAEHGALQAHRKSTRLNSSHSCATRMPTY